MSDLWEYGGNTDDSETSSNSSDGARELAEVVNDFEEDEEEERGWAAGFGAGGGDDELGSIPAYADVVDEEAAKAQHVLQNCLRGGMRRRRRR
eukprot:jgi/Picre1/31134/NNA_006488.t1